MKRLLLIGLIVISVGWIIFSSYELWVNKDNTTEPQYVFCEADQSILVVNHLNEIKNTDFLTIVSNNPLASELNDFDFKTLEDLKIYISGQRPIIILEKDTRWDSEEIEQVKKSFVTPDVQFKNVGSQFMIYLKFEVCQSHLKPNFFLDADKKASANFWESIENQWKRTDVYNLDKGYFEYRSSAPEMLYGEAVRDIELFSSVIPVSNTTYLFEERFYAQKNDSVYKDGPMDLWVNQGFVTINYEGTPVVISDYRSQQTPSLILIEQVDNEESIEILDDMYSFIGFQLTKDFPSKPNGRFYCFEIEDKALFVESEEIAKKIMVDYQLGKTLALSPERQEVFFGGLPSFVNKRNISLDQKSSVTWKDKLLFEVKAQPPSEQFSPVDKLVWSVSPKFDTEQIIPIPDHLRKGTSLLAIGKEGQYQLFGPNGETLWGGKLDGSVYGKMEIIDLFENDKHQFLIHTKNRVYLIDLNGNLVGSFPYKSDYEITSEISLFEWNGTKRFLFGNEKGEVTMINHNGQELNIIQMGREAITSTPYALNIRGNLRAWAMNNENQSYLGYLETPAKAGLLSKIEGENSVKHSGKIITYFEREGSVYMVEFNSKTNKTGEAKLIDEGRIKDVNQDFIVIAQKNNYKVIDHNLKIIYSKQLPFNEIGTFNYHPEQNTSVVLDYLQNKIHVYGKTGDEFEDFPKEGRNFALSYYNKNDKTLFIYTVLAQSIICYKTKF